MPILGQLELNPRNKQNATPLQLAAEKEHYEVVKRLVELGADLNTKRNDGWSPLYTASYNGDLNTVVFLCSKGADVNGVNDVSMPYSIVSIHRFVWFVWFVWFDCLFSSTYDSLTSIDHISRKDGIPFMQRVLKATIK